MILTCGGETQSFMTHTCNYFRYVIISAMDPNPVEVHTENQRMCFMSTTTTGCKTLNPSVKRKAVTSQSGLTLPRNVTNIELKPITVA